MVVAEVLHSVEEVGCLVLFFAQELERDGGLGVGVWVVFPDAVDGGLADCHLEDVDAAEGPVFLRDAEDREFLSRGVGLVGLLHFAEEFGEVFRGFVTVDGVVGEEGDVEGFGGVSTGFECGGFRVGVDWISGSRSVLRRAGRWGRCVGFGGLALLG